MNSRRYDIFYNSQTNLEPEEMAGTLGCWWGPGTSVSLRLYFLLHMPFPNRQNIATLIIAEGYKSQQKGCLKVIAIDG